MTRFNWWRTDQWATRRGEPIGHWLMRTCT